MHQSDEGARGKDRRRTGEARATSSSHKAPAGMRGPTQLKTRRGTKKTREEHNTITAVSITTQTTNPRARRTPRPATLEAPRIGKGGTSTASVRFTHQRLHLARLEEFVDLLDCLGTNAGDLAFLRSIEPKNQAREAIKLILRMLSKHRLRTRWRPKVEESDGCLGELLCSDSFDQIGHHHRLLV